MFDYQNINVLIQNRQLPKTHGAEYVVKIRVQEMERPHQSLGNTGLEDLGKNVLLVKTQRGNI